MNLWDRIRASLTPARVTPIVMTVLGSLVTVGVAWLAKHGLNLDQTAVLAILGPMVLGVVGAALQWQNGQKQLDTTEAAVDEYLRKNDTHPEHFEPDLDDLDSERAKHEEATEFTEKIAKPKR